MTVKLKVSEMFHFYISCETRGFTTILEIMDNNSFRLVSWVTSIHQAGSYDIT